MGGKNPMKPGDKSWRTDQDRWARGYEYEINSLCQAASYTPLIITTWHISFGGGALWKDMFCLKRIAWIAWLGGGCSGNERTLTWLEKMCRVSLRSSALSLSKHSISFKTLLGLRYTRYILNCVLRNTCSLLLAKQFACEEKNPRQQQELLIFSTRRCFLFKLQVKCSFRSRIH